MKSVGKHFKWRVRTQQVGKHFCVYYQYDYPHGTVENRDTRRFNSLAEAEEFAETMRRTNRIFTHRYRRKLNCQLGLVARNSKSKIRRRQRLRDLNI
jgi:hypothetical protein